MPTGMAERSIRSLFGGPGAIGALATTAAGLGLASVGVSPWWAGPAAVIDTTIRAGLPALAWMLGAWGLGGALSFLWRGEASASVRWALRLAVGVGVMLWLSHLMGVLGMLRADAAGAAFAWAPAAAGMVLLLRDSVQGATGGLSASAESVGGRTARPSGQAVAPMLWLVAAPAVAAMIVAACAPPGTLWRSEAHGFDVLSYHLQLPREWLAAGRLWPLDHNAYSWLPSYVEAAYLHMAAVSLWAGDDRFVGGDGMPTFSASLLHAMMALASAWALAVLVEDAARRRLPTDERAARTVGALAGVLFLATPWVVVTGSLAYNEMAVILPLVGGLLALESAEVSPARRGALVGLLAGAACGAKATALFMVGVPLGVLLLGRTTRRRWPAAVGWGCLAGLVMLLPWLVRNAAACGNPVFPYLTSVFGDGRWTPIEVERWRIGHHAAGGVIERLRLLASARGFAHAQWGATAAAGLAAAVIGVAWKRTRPAARPYALLAAVQVLFWLAVGHLQSRFLLPTAALLAALPAIVLAGASTGRRRSIPMPAGIVAAALALLPAFLLLRESRWPPGALAAAGIQTMTGEAFRADPGRGEVERIGPAGWVNLHLNRPGVRLHLLGDSTPFYFRVPVLYHTTWDPSPLGVLLRETGGDIGESVRRLAAQPPRGAGISHVLVSFAELGRLNREGWYDPSVTVETARALAEGHGRVLAEWEGRALIEVGGDDGP